MLDARAILAEAEAIAGFGNNDAHLHRNLEALVDSLNGDAKLNPSGEAAARRGLVARQADRIAGLKWSANYPEIADEVIECPVFLCGLPRSGTTYFQYLFDRDRRFRLIRTWQSLMPLPPPGFDPQSVTQRKAMEEERRAALRPKAVENFAALHLLDADGPDECHALLEQTGAAAGFFNLYDVPRYFDYLMNEADLVAAYASHKRQLQLLQWRLPKCAWALKYPNHIIAMDSILNVYPDARFAITHRDPLQVLASIAKMSLSLRTARYDAVDPHRVGGQMLDFIDRHIQRIMALADGPNADRAVHVDYYALVADPGGTMAKVHGGLGLPSPDDVMAAITGWRRENPKNARGANDYALAQFGLSADEAEERFAAYRRRFAIPREADALAAIS
ncbi:MAG: sulfotransferase [Novosphingobium sp.]